MKKVLLLFGSAGNREVLCDSAVYLRDNFSFEIHPLYIKDIRREEVIPTSVEGVVLDPGNNVMVQEWETFENEEIKEIRNILFNKGINAKLSVEIGFIPDIVKEYMKISDLLLMSRTEYVSENTISLLKNQYKPLIMVGKNPLQLSKIGISTDDGVKINKSTTSFLNMFPQIESFTMLAWNYDSDENSLLEYLKDRDKEATFNNFQGDMGKVEFYERIKQLDLLIMGNLSRSYFFEKITRRKGLNILENAQTSIFIG